MKAKTKPKKDVKPPPTKEEMALFAALFEKSVWDECCKDRQFLEFVSTDLVLAMSRAIILSPDSENS